MVTNAVSQHKCGKLSTESFRQEIDEQRNVTGEVKTLKESILSSELSTLDELPDLKEVEQLIISEALKRADGNQTIAANLLNMSRHALNKRLVRSKKLSDDQ